MASKHQREYYKGKLLRDRSNLGTRTPGTDALDLTITNREVDVGCIGQHLPIGQPTMAWRDNAGRLYALGSEFLPARLTKYYAAEKDEYGIDQKWAEGGPTFGVYDWVEVGIKTNEDWKDVDNGQSGTFCAGTGAIDINFADLVLLEDQPQTGQSDQGETNKRVVYLRRIYQIGSSSSSSSGEGGFSYMFDLGYSDLQIKLVHIRTRVKITNPGHGASQFSGVYGGVEVYRSQDGLWIPPADHPLMFDPNAGTGIVFADFCNPNIHVAPDHTEWIAPTIPGSVGRSSVHCGSSSSSSSSSSSGAVGWKWIFLDGLTNEAKALRDIAKCP